MGGSSSVNAQMFLRGVPEDYDNWAGWGNDQWNFQNLLPYFRKTESDQDYRGDFHGTDGPIICSRLKPRRMAASPAGLLRRLPICRVRRLPGSQRSRLHRCWTARVQHGEPSAMEHGDCLRRSRPPAAEPHHPVPTAWCVGYCSTARVRWASRWRAAEETFTVQGREVILSAGEIGLPHILMLSGVGPEEHLRDHGIPVIENLPGVGQNLRDHPMVQLTWSAKPGVELDPAAKVSGLALRYTAGGSEWRNDMIVYMASAMSERPDRGGDRMEPIGIGVTAVINLAVGAGEVRLNSSDPKEQPNINFNYLAEAFDRERMREVVRICDELLTSEAFSRIASDRIHPSPDLDIASDNELDRWLTRNVTTGHHSSCTCKMGPAEDPMAVVDQYGRVRGLQALRVTDASIMPDCVRANINATVLAMGERVADFIREGR